MASQWVGIDGSGNGSLIQAGVTERPGPGPGGTATTDTFAWWEVLPLASQPVTAVTVGPGDEVSIAIDQVSGDNWSIRVTDLTNGQGSTQNVYYTGPGTSAEWILEAPVDSQTGQPVPLAPYAPAVIFSHLATTGNSSSLSQVEMAQADQQVATPSALGPSGFSVAYGSTAAPAP